MTAKQGLQKLTHDRQAKALELNIGQEVMARRYRDRDKWIPGVVVEHKGVLLYTFQIETGWRRHIDQLRELTGSTTSNTPAVATEEASESYDIEQSHANESLYETPQSKTLIPVLTVLHPGSQLCLHPQYLVQLELKLLNVSAILRELEIVRTCMVIDLCTIMLFLIVFWNFMLCYDLMLALS